MWRERGLEAAATGIGTPRRIPRQGHAVASELRRRRRRVRAKETVRSAWRLYS